MRKFFLYIPILFLICSCEDVIEVDITDGDIQLSVDAFINNKKGSQKITLKSTEQFFGEVSQLPFIADSVYVTNNHGEKYIFEDLNSTGVYEWNQTDSSLVKSGDTYILTIKESETIYTSTSEAFPVAEIDSINWIYSPPFFESQSGTYIVEGVIRDLAGQDDFTWVRIKINNEYIKRKSSIVIAKNNSNVGLDTDGDYFIPPAAWYSPPTNDTNSLILLGDTVTYETWSVSEETSLFWSEVLNQNIDGAIGAIFATPTANVRSNIFSNSSEVGKKAVGWFSVSIVNEETVVLYDKPGERLEFDTN